MAGGPLVGARVALRYAKPWQRAAVLAAMVGAGVALIVIGDPKGVVLVAVGALLALLYLPRIRTPRRALGGGDHADFDGDGRPLEDEAAAR